MPTEAVFGPGSFGALGDRSRTLGKRPLIVTGKNSARKTGILDRALLQLEHAAVFDAVEENPGAATCERGADLCRQIGCDHVIAIGGGSPMDVAKAVAGLAVNQGKCADHFGPGGLAEGALPIIAVPTTAGTGSEVTPYAVIVDTESRTKKTLSAKALFPRVALADPELTRTMPRGVTVNTGLDVLSQAMEGIVSRKSTPVGDALALDACRRVREFLPRAAANGDDLEARSEMLYASMLSGCVIAQSGTTLVHGMGYYYTLECGVPHGLANGLLLSPLFRFNATVAPEKVSDILVALVSGGNHSVTTSHEERTERVMVIHAMRHSLQEELPKAIVTVLHEFLRELGVSPAGQDHGVDGARLREFAEGVGSDPYRYRNQIGEITPSLICEFYEESFGGRPR